MKKENADATKKNPSIKKKSYRHTDNTDIFTCDEYCKIKSMRKMILTLIIHLQTTTVTEGLYLVIFGMENNNQVQLNPRIMQVKKK